jgi:hypothetical protein
MNNQDKKMPFDSSRPFDGDAFNKEEYEHWIKTTNSYSSIILWSNDIHRVRQKVLGYARTRNHVLETTKINDTTIKITFTGNLYV